MEKDRNIETSYTGTLSGKSRRKWIRAKEYNVLVRNEASKKAESRIA